MSHVMSSESQCRTQWQKGKWPWLCFRVRKLWLWHGLTTFDRFSLQGRSAAFCRRCWHQGFFPISQVSSFTWPGFCHTVPSSFGVRISVHVRQQTGVDAAQLREVWTERLCQTKALRQVQTVSFRQSRKSECGGS